MSKIVSDSNLQEFGTKLKSKLATVATSGSYSDLSNKPTIPSAPGTLNTNNTTTQTASSSEALSGTIKLHKVSKTGSYNDLLNKPTIPTVTNGLIEVKGFSGTDSGTTYALPDEATNEDEVLATQDYVATAISNINSEVWTFELENGTTVTKTVLLG